MAIKVAATSNIWVTRFFKLSTQLLFSKVTDTPDEICQLMNGTKVSDVRGDTCEYLSPAGLNRPDATCNFELLGPLSS